MKRILILFIVSAITLSTFAQKESDGYVSMRCKNKEYLPKAGDVTLGVNLIPFLNYFGNMFNGNLDNKLNPGEIGGNPAIPVNPNSPKNTFSIFGKYFLTDNTAIRANFAVNANSNTNKYYAKNDLDKDPLSDIKVEDKYKANESGFSLSVGYEWRRGYKRLQGFWGAQMILGYNVSKETYSYGNAMTKDNPNPSTGIPSAVAGDSRLLSAKNGNTFIGGFGGFTGVEYYIAPKIAIGCELSLNMLWSRTGKKNVKKESFDREINVVKEKTYDLSPGESSFHFGTENIGTSLYVAFSF